MPKTTNKPIARTTTGKGKNYNPTEKGAGMTAKGRAAYNARKSSLRLSAMSCRLRMSSADNLKVYYDLMFKDEK